WLSLNPCIPRDGRACPSHLSARAKSTAVLRCGLAALPLSHAQRPRRNRPPLARPFFLRRDKSSPPFIAYQSRVTSGSRQNRLAVLAVCGSRARSPGTATRVGLLACPRTTAFNFCIQGQIRLTRHLVIGSQGRWPFPGGDAGARRAAGGVG